MKAIIVAIVLSVFSLSVSAEEKALYTCKYPELPTLIQDTPCPEGYVTEHVRECDELALNDDIERRGCCSHHGGVCGCAGGRTQCCDGTLSPSCRC
jgi:hypothetical protein